MAFFKSKKILVTGGASFIGSHLVESLVECGGDVRVADNFSSGKVENLASVKNQVEVFEGDLKDCEFAKLATQDCEIVFHLAADHGGRGYIATHPANCSTNMALDNIVFENAVRNGVDRITFASSGCVYPTDIQQGKTLLREDMVSFTERGGAFADEEYGWAKLMGELSLKAFNKQFGTKASSVRIFTAYGPRENESHAIIALIAKAVIQQSPFEIWGDGEQSRNFTFVNDIVNGLMLACEHITDGSAVNAGTSDFVSLNLAAQTIFDLIGWTPPNGIHHQTDKPVGVKHRAADTRIARETTGWVPQFTLEQGLLETIDWYTRNRNKEVVKTELEHLLMER